MMFQRFILLSTLGLLGANTASAASFTLTSGFSVSLDSAVFSGGGSATETLDYDIGIDTDPYDDNFTELGIYGGASGTNNSLLPSGGVASAALEATGQADAPGDEVYFDALVTSFFDVTNLGTSDITFTFSYSLFATADVGADMLAGAIVESALFAEHADTGNILFEDYVEAYAFNLGPYFGPVGPDLPADAASGSFSVTLAGDETAWLTLDTYALAGAMPTIPLPATGWLLLAAGGALVTLRRRA